MPFHVGVDTVLLGKLGLLECQTEYCQPLGITAYLVQRPGLCRAEAVLAQLSPQTLWSCECSYQGRGCSGKLHHVSL